MDASLLRTLKIPELTLRDTILFDITCALFTHTIYKRYETDASRLLIHLILLVVIPTFPAACFVSHFPESTHLALLASFTLFYVTLITSIVLYRLSPWHPLAKYPGPILARITKLWGAVVMINGKNHVRFKQLHEKYGPYVRVGPNEISVIDVSAIPHILGGDGMPKGPMWTARKASSKTPFHTLIALQSAKEHARRRRPWNRAFNTTAVKEYEPTIQKRALQLVHELETRSKSDGELKGEGPRSLNLAAWLNYFTTDFMGDMAFGGGFELMHDGGDKVGIWAQMEAGMKFMAFFQHFPWLMPLFAKLSLESKDMAKFRNFAFDRVRQRKTNGSAVKDLFYHLIDEGDVEKVKPADSEIISDGVLAMIAGSDTTSTVLSSLFSLLLRNPKEYARLQREVDEAFPPGEGDPFDTTKLAEMPFLNAVINETMRLLPPVPTYLQRAPEAGTGGKWIKDSFIPEGTAVVVPPYALLRSPTYFSPNPDSFWPDRWMHESVVRRTALQEANFEFKAVSGSSEDVMTNMAAFIPFSYGPAVCAGRLLAIVEMRMVAALIMQRFEMRFADGYDPRDWEEAMKDYFVAESGKLPVVLTPRI